MTLRNLTPRLVCAAILGFLAANPCTANDAVRIVRGPVLGSPEPGAVRIWVQGSVPVEVRIEAQPVKGGTPTVQSAWRELNPKKRLMATFELAGLSPETTYRYRVEGRDRTIWAKDDAEFTTPPERDRPARVTIATGSGANQWRQPRPSIWRAVAEAEPDIFLALGDTPYADGLLWEDNETWEVARETYADDPSRENRHVLRTAEILFRTRASEALALAYEHFRERRAFGKMARKSFWVATWDDHDTGIDNGDRDNPALGPALSVFKQFTPNPSFGLPGAPGVFFVQRWGDIDVVLIDDQSWRTPTVEALADPEAATLLGEVQLQWLIEQLRTSTATFKIIAAGSPFNDHSRKEDSWVTYPRERDRLMEAIAENRVDGVVLVSGDVHRSELFVLPWLQERGGYPLVELVASPLFQKGRSCGPAVEHREFCAGTTESEILELYGWIEADTTLADPTLSLQVRDAENEVLMDRLFHASDLKWKNRPGDGAFPEHLE